MVWVTKHKRATSLLVWCLLALVTLAQLQSSLHFHDHDDIGYVNDCAVCAVAVHLDDVDVSDKQLFAAVAAHNLPDLTPLSEISSTSRLRIKTRAPPIS